MTLLRKRKKQQHRRRNLLLAGAGIGGLAAASTLALSRRSPSKISNSISSIRPRAVTSTPISSPENKTPNQPPISSIRPRYPVSASVKRESNRISSIKPKTTIVPVGGAIVHIPGLGKTYYPSSPLIERNVRLGKPGGRPRSRKNWNNWDYYRESNKGAYNLRNTRRYDRGRF